jgi:hypothetical protein
MLMRKISASLRVGRRTISWLSSRELLSQEIVRSTTQRRGMPRSGATGRTQLTPLLAVSVLDSPPRS